MKELYFDYYMKIEYEEEVSKCNFTIKCLPQNNARQTIHNTKISLYPETEIMYGKDGLGNLQIYGLNRTPHKQFWFRITGIAKVGLEEYEELEDDSLSMIFKHPHGKNCPGPCICAYYKKITQEIQQIVSFTERHTGQDALRYAQMVMHLLYRDFKYQPNSTRIETTAEEAFAQGYGVCQDYAHIFISLMHLSGIPARYVTGLIIGEGASHAWVEVLADGKWYGFDPTNDKRVGEEHIKIGIGRDAQDCMINRGIMHGGGLHLQTIQVHVEE